MFEQAKGDLEAANGTLLDVGRKAVKSALVEFMAAHPEVAALRWRGYAPSFNDGDPCYFSVHEPELKLREDRPVPEADAAGDGRGEDEDEDEFDEDDEDFIDLWSLPKDAAGKRLRKDAESLHEVLQLAEDAVIDLFGEGHEVTVGPDGEAKVEEYDEC